MSNDFIPEQNSPMPNVDKLESTENLYDVWEENVRKLQDQLSNLPNPEEVCDQPTGSGVYE